MRYYLIFGTYFDKPNDEELLGFCIPEKYPELSSTFKKDSNISCLRVMMVDSVPKMVRNA